MPDASLRIVADLRLQVDDARGATTAHLTSDQHGLVLDADDPARLLRALPPRRLRADLPVRAPAGLFAGQQVRLRSRGTDLGRVRLTDGGGFRVVPTRAGVQVAVGAVPRGSIITGAVLLVLGILVRTAARR